jgi:hypothetical protein
MTVDFQDGRAGLARMRAVRAGDDHEIVHLLEQGPNRTHRNGHENENGQSARIVAKIANSQRNTLAALHHACLDKRTDNAGFLVFWSRRGRHGTARRQAPDGCDAGCF